MKIERPPATSKDKLSAAVHVSKMVIKLLEMGVSKDAVHAALLEAAKKLVD